MKNETIYGISYIPGDYFSGEMFRFSSREDAEMWLHTETYCFAEREIGKDPELLWRDNSDYMPSIDEVDNIDDWIYDYVPKAETTEEPKYIIANPATADAWGFEGQGPHIVTLEEIRELSKEWGVPVDELIAETDVRLA